MNWRLLRPWPWLDTRARFVAGTPHGGCLLDLGSSDGETLRHIAELRPDLRLFAVDKVGQPDRYPPGCVFQRVDLESDRLPWPDGSMDAVTCMHVVEHLHELNLLMDEVARLLKRGGRVYFETPHPKTLRLPSSRSRRSRVPFTLNFYDDPTHVRVVSIAELETHLRRRGLEILGSGISRNWLFALSHWWFRWGPPDRRQMTALVHWLGWSAWISARKPSAVPAKPWGPRAEQPLAGAA